MLKRIPLYLGILGSTEAFAGPLCDAIKGHEWCVREQQRFLREGGLQNLGRGLSNAGGALQNIDRSPGLTQSYRCKRGFGRNSWDCERD
jgi:hypothetical protein